MKNKALQINTFLACAGWAKANSELLQADASSRQYWRLRSGNQSALLMVSPPPELPVSTFSQIAQFLRQHNLLAPEIMAQDDENDLLLIQDFGDETFTRVLEKQPSMETRLYDMAIDALVKLHRIDSYQNIKLANYDANTLLGESRLCLRWLFPRMHGVKANDEQSTQFDAAWKLSFSALPQHQDVLVLRDYHVDNLMRVSLLDGSDACGLLDFQDALMGSPAYDLVSLTEDARRDVSDSLKEHCLQRYFAKSSANLNLPNRQILEPWLNVLAAQRHAKVLGIFVRLAQRDNKKHYLIYMQRVANLLQEALNREPLLQPVAKWFDDYLALPEIIAEFS